ncbi:probable serine/threonine-protein kinase WNK4, partial [Capsicum annuum]|uniref:probable serine/threonine-protein kinase WNK4 n=1 Tax=Capsicum annuum TaxID=4072 RepID=UPI001FB0E4CB
MCMLELVIFEDPYSECKNPARIFKKVSSGVKPASLVKVTDPQIKIFIEKCLVPASLRLPTKDLLKDPFLQIKNLNEPTHNSEYNQSVYTDSHCGSPCAPTLEFQRFNRNNEFKLTGKKKDENSVSLTLRIKSPSGRVRNIHFNFYLYTITALLVAAEMVEHLELVDHDVDFIADFIDYLIMKILPSLKPSDYFSSGGRSQREEAIEHYLNLSPITTTSNARQDDIPVLNMNNQIGSTHRADEDKFSISSFMAPKIDQRDPLFIGALDSSSTILVPIKLTGKRKYGFVTRSCSKESYREELHEQWKRCNAIVLSWIMNTVSESLLSGIVYTTNACVVWDDFKERYDKVNCMRIYQLHCEITMHSQ